MEFKNPNIPHGRGPIDPAYFTPYPKNPTLWRFLIRLGRYEELGSGVNNVARYLPFSDPGAVLCFRPPHPHFRNSTASLP